MALGFHVLSIALIAAFLVFVVKKRLLYDGKRKGRKRKRAKRGERQTTAATSMSSI